MLGELSQPYRPARPLTSDTASFPSSWTPTAKETTMPKFPPISRQTLAAIVHHYERQALDDELRRLETRAPAARRVQPRPPVCWQRNVVVRAA
jgi:hypothetical protein